MSHIIVTAALALLVFFTVIIYGFWKNGLHFFNLFVPKGIPIYILPLIVFIEVLSFLAAGLPQRAPVRQYADGPHHAVRVRKLHPHARRARRPRLAPRQQGSERAVEWPLASRTQNDSACSMIRAEGSGGAAVLPCRRYPLNQRPHGSVPRIAPDVPPLAWQAQSQRTLRRYSGDSRSRSNRPLRALSRAPRRLRKPLVHPRAFDAEACILDGGGLRLDSVRRICADLLAATARGHLRGLAPPSPTWRSVLCLGPVPAVANGACRQRAARPSPRRHRTSSKCRSRRSGRA
jgi:hypothetical protein